MAFSNYAYPKKEDQEDGAVFLKVRGKPGISKKNLIVIPLLTFLLMLTGVDVLQTSAQLLSDPDQYGLDSAKAASVNTNSMTIAMVASMGMLLVGGIFYDLLGRKTTIVMMFLIGALTCFPIPFGRSF